MKSKKTESIELYTLLATLNSLENNFKEVLSGFLELNHKLTVNKLIIEDFLTTIQDKKTEVKDYSETIRSVSIINALTEIKQRYTLYNRKLENVYAKHTIVHVLRAYGFTLSKCAEYALQGDHSTALHSDNMYKDLFFMKTEKFMPVRNDILNIFSKYLDLPQSILEE